MRCKGLKLGAVLLIGVELTGLQAQESLVAAGGNATGNGSVGYSFGQITYHSFKTTSGSSSEGVQQPFEISLVGTDEVKGINYFIVAYPNPTSYQLMLSISEPDLSNLSYQLYDLQGKLLLSEKISSRQTSIPMNQLVTSAYLLRVIQDNKAVKSFKIIKK